MNDKQAKNLERLAVATIYSVVGIVVSAGLLGVYALANLVF